MGENYFGITDQGRQRVNNEDRFIAQTVFNNNFVAACVIDGVGGYAGGEVAAQITRDAIIGGLKKLAGNIIDQLVSALENANEKIIREKESSPQNEKMACVVTLAVVDMEANVLYFAHVGDTRLYLFRDGSLIKITRDHSTVGFLEESGRLTEEAAMAHPKRNEVNKVLGYEPNIALAKDFIDTGESPFLPGDTILICSDGLTDMVPAAKIISILMGQDELPIKGELLINAANEAGGKDNITVTLVRNDKLQAHHAVTKPLVALQKNELDVDGEFKANEHDVDKAMQGIKKNSAQKINKLLVFFCALFFAGFAGLMFKELNKNKEAINTQPPVILAKQRSQPELNFLDSINAASNQVVTLTNGQPIIISDTILIKNDSLHIIGNGNSFVRDSAYAGPAFIISTTCKYILLDSLNLENFNVGVLVLNKGLHLKNVRFKNCRSAIQFQQQLPQDTTISGTQAETLFYYNDTLRR